MVLKDRNKSVRGEDRVNDRQSVRVQLHGGLRPGGFGNRHSLGVKQFVKPD